MLCVYASKGIFQDQISAALLKTHEQIKALLPREHPLLLELQMTASSLCLLRLQSWRRKIMCKIPLLTPVCNDLVTHRIITYKVGL